MKVYSKAAALAAAQLCLASAATAQDLPPRDDSQYLYTLDLNAAIDCTLLQDGLARLKKESDPEWSRFHGAMALVWQSLSDRLNGAEVANEAFNARWAAILERPMPANDELAAYHYLARPCEVISTIHSQTFLDAERDAEKLNPELFAIDTRKNQAGSEYPEPPQKEIEFRDWFFMARGNSCLAAHRFDDGAVLTLGFTNFFDGALSFEWEGLPMLDANSDSYEDDFAPHEAGADSDEDFVPQIADGFSYATYPGTAIFIDGKLVAGPFGQGRSDGQKYYFGVAIQRPYYSMLPAGEVLTIKVLGRETHSLNIDDPAFWNEMSNCMAQYPFG